MNGCIEFDRVNNGRKLTPLRRLKIDPLPGVADRVGWSVARWWDLLGVEVEVEVEVAATAALGGGGLGGSGLSTAVGGLTASR